MYYNYTSLLLFIYKLRTIFGRSRSRPSMGLNVTLEHSNNNRSDQEQQGDVVGDSPVEASASSVLCKE